MKLLEHLQVSYTGEDDNVKTDCIWCGSTALSIDSEAPHQFQCFRCKQSGNAFTYLRRWYDNLPKLSKTEATRLCDMKRGIKPLTLRDTGVRYTLGCYWIPVYNQKNHLMALHKYVPETNIVYSSPKPTSLTILGLNSLSKSDTVWVAEGHWDYFTLLPYMAGTGIDLLGTSGSYFNSAQLPALKDRHIVLLYDNDIAGKDGVEYVAKHLKTSTIPHLSLSYLDWSKITLPTGNLEPGFDVRDLHNVYN